jgi:hypothetical protein
MGMPMDKTIDYFAEKLAPRIVERIMMEPSKYVSGLTGTAAKLIMETELYRLTHFYPDPERDRIYEAMAQHPEIKLAFDLANDLLQEFAESRIRAIENPRDYHSRVDFI